MEKKRKQHNAEFKFKVALEAAKDQKTLNQLASEYGIHPTQISEWKGQLLRGGTNVFRRGGNKAEEEQIGRLKMELEWVKKKVARNGG